MVDERRVLRLLRYLPDTLVQLDAEAGAGSDRRADPMWIQAIKFLFMTGIDACSNVAQHVCASSGWGPPDDNGHAMQILARRGVFARALGDRMAEAVRFRNVLVHHYVDTDDARVERQLHDLDHLRGFRDEVLAFLGRHRQESETEGG